MTDADLHALAARVTASAVCDALWRRHPHRAHVIGLVSPRPGTVLLGRARTVAFLPNRADHAAPDFVDLAAGALGDGDPAGSVLVVGTSGHPDAAVAGSRKLARLEAAGWGGMVADGRIRDLAEVGTFRMGVYCRGETPRASGDVVSPALAGGPVDLAGARVAGGDWVLADASGAVVVPDACIGEVLEDAVRIEERDAADVAAALAARG